MKYLNAINILTSGKIGSLQKIHNDFEGNFQVAWHNDLTKYLPKGSSVEMRKNIDPDREIKILENNSIKLLTILDDAYPKLLKEITDPPFLLYVKGNIDVLSSHCLGVVGTRSFTDYGKQLTPSIVRELSRAGLTIVSGLAMGIDTLAHRAALDANQKTIAVLGCGLSSNVMYPPQNKKLADEIINNGGAIISEYSFNTQGSKITFPQRNRIINGLSRGVLVIEADIQSGAMITARFATEENRELFMVPGSIYSKYSEGTNMYIQKGAKLVTNAKDILTEFEISYNDLEPQVLAGNEMEEKILATLSKEPTHVDEVICQSGLDTATVLSTLVVMEIDEKIKNLGSDKYVLKT